MPGKNSITFCFGILITFNLAHAQEAKLVLPIGITESVSALRYSPDGKLILTAGDYALKIWNAASGKLLSEYRDMSGILDASFYPDNKRILVITSTDSLKILDILTTRITTVIKTGIEIENAVLSPDGTRILTFSYDSTVRIWNTETKQKIMQARLDALSISHAGFSPDGDKFYTIGLFGSLQVWDIKTNKLLLRIKNVMETKSLSFSPDGNTLAVSFSDTVKLWKVGPGKLTSLSQFRVSRGTLDIKFSPEGSKLATATNHEITIMNAADHSFLCSIKYAPSFSGQYELICFSPDGQKILAESGDSAKVLNANTGAFLFYLKGARDYTAHQSFSPDSKRILAVRGYSHPPFIWDARNGSPVASLAGHTNYIEAYEISKNGNRALLHFYEGKPKLFDAITGQLVSNLDNAQMSPDRKKILIISKDSTIELFDAETLRKDQSIKELRGNISLVTFTRDTKKIMAIYTNGNVRIWDIEAGTMLTNVFIPDSVSYEKIDLSPDNSTFMAVAADEGIIEVWDIKTGQRIHTLVPADYIAEAQFSADGKTILTVTNTIFAYTSIWDVKTGKLLKDIPPQWTTFVTLSKDRTKALINSYDVPLILLDAGTGAFIREIKYKYSEFYQVNFSDDGKNIVIVTNNGQLKIVDLASGKETVKPADSARYVHTEAITADGKYFFTSSRNMQIMDKWDIQQNKLLFSFFPVDSLDYLVTDEFNHYDGTDAARKLLYFTCGTEIIDLDQVKDQLWVPNLAERITNRDTLHARTLKELNLCGLVPEVEEADNRGDAFAFHITPRRGGLGETVLYVNEIETKRYHPGQLTKTGGSYELLIKKDELAPYFIPGAENSVTVKSYTADNAIASRGFKISENKNRPDSLPTNLYAVMIGVSDYKGEELDLKYAAKDATDISNTVANAARKLLDIDGQEHVFMYNMTTATNHYQLPEKSSIKKIFEDIGHKATSNDILLVFFAGHGVMTGEGDKKQFYFLTADASPATALAATSDVGISTAELTEWMKPQNIKAQKRVLIFDACNSGQAINDLVKIGGNNQGYTASRDDDKPRLQKAIDKLNEKSGLFILAASASDQDAYEMGRYSQGLLTYSLLKAVKQDPTILDEGKFLDLSRWFTTAEKTVSDIARENRARQEPQIVSTTNFNIGIVDDEVMAKIVLPQEKPLFTASNFQNSDEAADGDNLDLSKLINLQLNEISTRGTDNPIVYITATNSPDAYTLSGRYDVKGNDITVRAGIKKNNEIKYRFEEKGTTTQLAELVIRITTKAAEWSEANR